ncbi:unnamed protein product, partial [Dicrocoelium dendriticum]
MKSLNIASVDAVTDCPTADIPSVEEAFILPDAPVHMEITDIDASDGIVDPTQMEGESRAPWPLKHKRKWARKARKPSAPKPGGDKTLKRQALELGTLPGVAVPSVRRGTVAFDPVDSCQTTMWHGWWSMWSKYTSSGRFLHIA